MKTSLPPAGNLRRKLCLSHFPAGGFHRAPLSLHRLHHEGKIRGLFAAHLNHGIRGEAAARDQRWCMAPANDWRFRLRQKPDVPSHAKANASLEQAARALRYDFWSVRGFPLTQASSQPRITGRSGGDGLDESDREAAQPGLAA
ncbi:MAG: ATP-binding protein [Eubacteriales bacterium]